MGISCKKPSRANTPRTQQFLTFLGELELSIHKIQDRPESVDDFNATIELDSSCIISRYEYDPRFGVKVEVSVVKLRAVFGTVALTIWKKLFMLIAKGGWSKQFKRKYDSIWSLNMNVMHGLALRKTKLNARGALTPADYLAMLADIEPMVVSHTYCGLVFNDDGFALTVRGPKTLIGESTRKVVLERQRELKAKAAAHNEANAERLELRDALLDDVKFERAA